MDDKIIRNKKAAKEAELQQVVANFNAGEQQRLQIVNALQQLRTQATHLEGQVAALNDLLGEGPPEGPTLPPEPEKEETPTEGKETSKEPPEDKISEVKA